jgi:hypothetical protein
MDRKRAIEILESPYRIQPHIIKENTDEAIKYNQENIEALNMAKTSLKTDEAYQLEYENRDAVDVIRCRDCKWWRDSDGEYRRGCGAESKCPINRREVFEGNGYCYLYEPQESDDKE